MGTKARTSEDLADVERDAVRTIKQALRWRHWNALREAGGARFPGLAGRIPNFTGAEAAAERLAALPVFERARTLVCNPDLPQRPLRAAALRAGKRLVVVAPKLALERPFLVLDPARLEPRSLWLASSLRGALELGEPQAAEALGRIDLVVVGAVAAARDGSRLGKGGGASDLAWALLTAAKAVNGRTPVVTSVHPSQLARSGALPMRAHDLPVDWIVTPERTLECPRRFPRPRGVRWRELSAERLAALPALAPPSKPRASGAEREGREREPPPRRATPLAEPEAADP